MVVKQNDHRTTLNIIIFNKWSFDLVFRNCCLDLFSTFWMIFQQNIPNINIIPPDSTYYCKMG